MKYLFSFACSLLGILLVVRSQGPAWAEFLAAVIFSTCGLILYDSLEQGGKNG